MTDIVSQLFFSLVPWYLYRSVNQNDHETAKRREPTLFGTSTVVCQTFNWLKAALLKYLCIQYRTIGKLTRCKYLDVCAVLCEATSSAANVNKIHHFWGTYDIYFHITFKPWRCTGNTYINESRLCSEACEISRKYDATSPRLRWAHACNSLIS